MLFKLLPPGPSFGAVPDHFDILIHAVSQSALGNYGTHQYGCYPEILSPFFALVGVSILKVSATFCLLYFLSLLLVVHVAIRLLKSGVLVCGFTLSVLLATAACVYMNFRTLDPYYQYYPIRFVGPAVIAFCLYQCLTPRASHKFWLSALTSAVLTYFLLRLHAGDTFDFFATTSAHRMFYLNGFLMIRMTPPPAPWLALGLLYLYGLAVGLRAGLRGEMRLWSGMLLYLSILGCGLFAYYQGRSHAYNFPNVIWPGLLILFILAGRVLRSVRGGLLPTPFVLLSFPALFLSVLSTMLFMYRAPELWTRTCEVADGLWRLEAPSLIKRNASFVKEMMRPYGNEANIIGAYQGLYYAETGLKAGLRCLGQIEMTTKSEWNSVCEGLAQAKCPLFVTSNLPGVDYAQERVSAPPWLLERYREFARSADGSVVFYLPLCALP